MSEWLSVHDMFYIGHRVRCCQISDFTNFSCNSSSKSIRTALRNRARQAPWLADTAFVIRDSPAAASIPRFSFGMCLENWRSRISCARTMDARRGSYGARRSESRMPEISMSSLMSRGGKGSGAPRAQLPRPSSTLLFARQNPGERIWIVPGGLALLLVAPS